MKALLRFLSTVALFGVASATHAQEWKASTAMKKLAKDRKSVV